MFCDKTFVRCRFEFMEPEVGHYFIPCDIYIYLSYTFTRIVLGKASSYKNHAKADIIQCGLLDPIKPPNPC